MTRQFILTTKDATKPTRATSGSAGYDIAASEAVTILPGEIKLVPTGVSVEMASDEVFSLYDRSSNPRKRGIVLTNSVGIIDSDFFPNALMGQFTNITDKPVTIEKGQAIMQGIFTKYLKVDGDATIGIRNGGFGSTDK